MASCYANCDGLRPARHTLHHISSTLRSTVPMLLGQVYDFLGESVIWIVISVGACASVSCLPQYHSDAHLPCSCVVTRPPMHDASHHGHATHPGA